MKVGLSSEKIQIALKKVHLLEHVCPRVEAYKQAITGSGLNQEELEILRKALLIKDEELKD